ncbi:MAG: hypothetical protein P8N51_02820 [Pseudomonadales bacterium]|nr:hypothetical protein [Pseudomonadales bacterium]MDG1443636.1 hypothetical protein [Pseudomonadales bacterium]
MNDMNYFKWLVIVILVTCLSFFGFLFYMSMHDGPIEIFSGGPFKSGTSMVDVSPDWSSLKDEQTIQVQSIDPKRSRTTWFAVIGARAFVPSGYMNTKIGKIWKKWPKQAERDPRSKIRIDGRIYTTTLSRVAADDPIIPAIVEELNRKYPSNASIEDIEANGTWIFEISSQGLIR